MDNDNKEANIVTKNNRFPVWIIIVAALVIIAATAGGIAIASANRPARKVARQLELARKYVAKLNYEQAIIAYKAAIEIDPKNADAYIELAQAYLKIGESESAKQVLEDALVKVPNEDIKKVETELTELKGLEKSVSDEPAPSLAPTSAPTPTPTPSPTSAPTSAPTEAPTPEPTSTPTPTPALAPTAAPTPEPTTTPAPTPTITPTAALTQEPTTIPTPTQTLAPTATPTPTPTLSPTPVPTPVTKAEVEINETNFPDSVFRDYVKESFDTNADGKLSEAECEVRNIEVNELGIKDLKGIEFFSALTHLQCDRNQLNILDVSKNTELTRLICSENQLTTLDLSKNTELTTLSCSWNQLTSLDVSQNTKLTYLSVSSNPLASLDVSKNTKLKTLYSGFNQLTTLDVRNCDPNIEVYADDGVTIIR